MVEGESESINSAASLQVAFLYFFKKDFIDLFLERGREEEKHQCVVAPRMPPTGDLACNPGIWPVWELNQ